MTFPTIAVAVGFTTRPTESPSWTDITPYVYSMSIRRGRDKEFSPMDIGTATLALDNADRRFDPEYTGAIANLCTNPSFETKLLPWTGDTVIDLTMTIWRETAYGYLGNGSLKIHNTTAGEDDYSSYSCAISPNTSYRISAYADASGATEPAFENRGLWVTDGTSTAVSEITTYPAGWTRHSVTITTAAAATTLTVRLYSPKGWIYWDAVQITEGLAAVPYRDGDQTDCHWYAGPHDSVTIWGGPYYGNLKPLKRIRIQVTVDSGTYDLFNGYVDGWPQAWDGGIVPVVQLRASDALAIINMFELNTTFAQELSSVRISNVLDEIGWTAGSAWILDSGTNSQLGTSTILAPAGDRLLATGDSEVVADTLDNVNALQHIQNVTHSEGGLFFVGGDGAVYFYNRHYAYGTAGVATFGDAVGELNYSDYQLDYDATMIYNDVRMSTPTGVPAEVSDATSQLEYFPRTLSDDRLLLTGDDEVADRANYFLGRYKDPHYRSRGFSLGGGTAALWEQMARREIADRITIIRRPQGGDAITILHRIEGLEHNIGLGARRGGQTWQTRYRLSTADAQSYWMITDGTDDFVANAELGVTTILGY